MLPALTNNQQQHQQQHQQQQQQQQQQPEQPEQQPMSTVPSPIIGVCNPLVTYLNGAIKYKISCRESRGNEPKRINEMAENVALNQNYQPKKNRQKSEKIPGIVQNYPLPR
jgi:hypothetical protein